MSIKIKNKEGIIYNGIGTKVMAKKAIKNGTTIYVIAYFNSILGNKYGKPVEVKDIESLEQAIKTVKVLGVYDNLKGYDCPTRSLKIAYLTKEESHIQPTKEVNQAVKVQVSNPVIETVVIHTCCSCANCNPQPEPLSEEEKIIIEKRKKEREDKEWERYRHNMKEIRESKEYSASSFYG